MVLYDLLYNVRIYIVLPNLEDYIAIPSALDSIVTPSVVDCIAFLSTEDCFMIRLLASFIFHNVGPCTFYVRVCSAAHNGAHLAAFLLYGFL